MENPWSTGDIIQGRAVIFRKNGKSNFAVDVDFASRRCLGLFPANCQEGFRVEVCTVDELKRTVCLVS